MSVRNSSEHSVITRYLAFRGGHFLGIDGGYKGQELYVGLTLLDAIVDYDIDRYGVWDLVCDYLLDAINAIGDKVKGSSSSAWPKCLLRHWTLFSAYYMITMLEACIEGHSPFG